MVITDEAESPPSPRLCVLKREEIESYGFQLCKEKDCKGHIIRNVVPAGVAESSGLRDGDRLLEVNNCYMDDVPHSEVARKINLSGNQLCLLVLDGDTYKRAVSRGQDLRGAARASRGESYKSPRLCHITRDPVSGLGINFIPVEGEKSCYSVTLVQGGAAEKAGVRQGDYLVWINGVTVSDLTHSALIKMIKKCGNHITILVIDSESKKYYMQQKMPILPTIAVPHNLPHRARTLHLDCGPDGYGFFLRLEITPSGRTLHILRKVHSGSPAERAGLKDGEVLLEVNGELVGTLKHEDVVDRVRMSGKQISFTTITQPGLEFYTQFGLSPLLFCEDDADENESKNRSPTCTAKELLQRDMHGLCKSRLCSLQKGPLGFGFKLGCVPQRPGTFISQVTSGGSGQRAGLRVGDVVLEINGQNVTDKYLEDVTMLMKEGGHFISLLVMDKTDSSDS